MSERCTHVVREQEQAPPLFAVHYSPCLSRELVFPVLQRFHLELAGRGTHLKKKIRSWERVTVCMLESGQGMRTGQGLWAALAHARYNGMLVR